MELSSWVRRVGVGLGLGLVVAACSGDGGSSDNRHALLEELCAGLDDCCRAAQKPNDTTSCVTLYSLGYASKSYDDVKGQTCLAAIKQARQDGSFCSVSVSLDENSSEPACAGVFTSAPTSGGTTPPGAACNQDSECALVEGATDASCLLDGSNGTTGGFCEVEVVRQAGGDCEDVPKGYNVTCDTKAGDYCDSFGTKKCVAAKGEGEDCAQGRCGPGLYCTFQGSGQACAKQGAQGEACDGSDSCVDGTYCSEAKTCAASLAIGAACTTSEACKGGYCNDGKCAGLGSFSLCTTPN